MTIPVYPEERGGLDLDSGTLTPLLKRMEAATAPAKPLMVY